ncbi:MAG: ABC transporter ATP-binding protein, partial [Spirochaetales bacterium]|nr:ABC transporter ATP-binding protein [Spirochaetales bacterium]MCF7936960.1 ABC transporter ATP-binding protein [Spirochaetales bacterium]
KSYGDLIAVNDLTFSVPAAACYGFLGPNGAGKTTMMKMLYGKAQPDRRDDTEMEVFGFDPRSAELDIKSLTGVVPQDNSLDEELNVVQNLRIFARYYGTPRARANQRIEELLEFMELSERRREKIRHLSGGMKRRLAIARALLNNPRLLILDEPTTGLDPQVRQLIWDKLRNLKRTGVTILLTTHYMDEAFQIADRIIIMDKGRAIVEGNPHELLEQEMESHVLELINVDRAKEVEQRLHEADYRRESADQRLIYYSNNAEVLAGMHSVLGTGDYIFRQSNLEDLFLKTTGRNLNELQ